jgi:hypothetical protein
MSQFQTILDALDNGLPEARKEAIAIVKQMMQAEPVGTVVDPTYVQMDKQLPYGTPLYAAPLYAAPLYAAPQAVSATTPPSWPKERDVGRLGDMSPHAHIRVGFDSDNDVYVSVWDENGGASIEFCQPGAGGGKSSKTRIALIALMVAMEADNADTPALDWWARRNGTAVTLGTVVRAPVSTTGHCKEKAKPGGCQLHNVQCGYPKCNRQ